MLLVHLTGTVIQVSAVTQSAQLAIAAQDLGILYKLHAADQLMTLAKIVYLDPHGIKTLFSVVLQQIQHVTPAQVNGMIFKKSAVVLLI